MKILITGINGFAGSHLAEYLRTLPAVEVAGLDVAAPSEDFLERMGENAPAVHCCNLADSDSVAAVIQKEQPDALIHLAARAQVAGAWENSSAIMETNVVCTQTLMQAMHESAPAARILLISSSEVYGKAVPSELPFTEGSPLRPGNPYSTSKLAQEFVGLQYHAAFGAEVVIARPFNHIGPRQVGNFVVASFARQIAEMEAGLKEPVLKVGNLDSARDFTDVRDIVRAYHIILTKGCPGERYNVASGSARTIKEMLDMLLQFARIKPRIEPVPELMRPSDTPIVMGDTSLLRSLDDWKPEVPIEASLEDALNHWRRQMAAK